MSLSLLFDPLFRVPFFTGLAFALALPLIGAYLRVRDEWLAALGLAQVAAAGGVLSVFVHWPLSLVAALAAGVAVLVKAALRRPGNDAYALMILLGWSLALLLAANEPHGADLGHALTDGQLYFTRLPNLLGGAGVVLAVLTLLPLLSSRLLLARFFPDYFAANRLPGWRYGLAFDVLAAASLALATAALGVMGAFALIFLPPWLAFALVRGWRRALFAAALLGVLVYLLAFAGAILYDQPFGPVLVAVLLLFALLRLALPRRYVVSQ